MNAALSLPVVRTGQALVPTALPSPSNFEAYARAVQQLPMLSAAQEKAYVAAWADHADRDAARELVLSHLKLVVKVVRAHRGYGLPEGDLAQEGTVGLMRAVHRFDPAVGVRLAAYAVRWIEAEIREFIFRSWRLVRMGGSAGAKKLFFGYRQTVEALRKMGADDRPKNVTAQDIATAMDLPLSQVHQAEAYFRGRDVALLAPADGEGASEQISLESVASDVAGPQELHEVSSMRASTQLAVRHALDTLPERDRDILIARKLQTPPVGLQELGDRLGISAERVRQLELRAMKAMKEQLIQVRQDL